MSKFDLSYKDSIHIVLDKFESGLTPSEIEREIIRQELRKNVVPSGIRSVLNTDHKCTNSHFLRKANGVYVNNPNYLQISVSKPSKNKVLVIERAKFEQIGYFNEIRTDFDKYRDSFLKNNDPIFIDRFKVEHEYESKNHLNKYKQIVSYIIIQYKNKLIRFQRHKTKVNFYEEYEDGQFSIGFGGHVQSTDHNIFSEYSGYPESIEREIFEETGITLEQINKIEFIGVLNDDSTPRGKNHFAFIHLVDLKSPVFSTKEKEVMNVQLVDFSEISAKFAHFELWSKLCLQQFFSQYLAKKCFFEKKNLISLSDQPKYLSLVGKIGTGKTKTASTIESISSYKHIQCSQILKELLLLEDVNISDRKSFQKAGFEYVNRKHGHEKFAQKIVEHLSKYENGTKFIFEGLRFVETQTEVEKILHCKIPIIYIVSPIYIRYKNYLGREKTPLSFSEFLEINDDPVERYIEDFLPKTNLYIYNAHSLTNFVAEITSFFSDELSEKFWTKPWDINAKSRHEQLLRGNDITFEQVNKPAILQEIKKFKNFPKNSILDIGCGTGTLTSYLSNYSTNIVGIDPSVESIKIAENDSKNSNISYHCCLIEDFITDQHFDIAIANMTLHTMKDLYKGLQKIYSLLVLHGLFIFTIPHPLYYPLRENHKQTFIEDGYEYNKESFHKIDFNISLEPNPLPSKTPYFHRPTHRYEAILHEIGFWLMETKILYPDDEIMKLYGEAWDYPHILLGVGYKH